MATQLLDGLSRQQFNPNRVPISIRLDPSVLDFFRRGGPGHLTRINKTLEKYIKWYESRYLISISIDSRLTKHFSGPEEISQVLDGYVKWQNRLQKKAAKQRLDQDARTAEIVRAERILPAVPTIIDDDPPEEKAGERRPEDDDSADVFVRRYASTALTKPLKAIEQEKIIRQFIANGRQGRDQIRLLMQHNTRLVIKVANRYRNRGVPVSDLVQEGYMGLYHAMLKYNKNRGVKFVTYAFWWIRERITKAIRYRSSLKEPDAARAIKREPDMSSRELSKKTGIPEHQIMKMKAFMQGPLSLDSSRSTELGESRRNLVETIRDPNAIDPYQAIDASSDKAILSGVLQKMPIADADFLRRRFGFLDGIVRTKLQMSEIYGIDRKEVVLWEDRCLKRLRDLIPDPAVFNCLG